jgi:hypothetical protein
MQKAMQEMLDEGQPSAGSKPDEDGRKKLTVKLQQSDGQADKGCGGVSIVV